MRAQPESTAGAGQTGYDTAGSVKEVARRGDPRSPRSPRDWQLNTYGMQVLREGIEDDEANFTRFLAVADPAGGRGAAKTRSCSRRTTSPG